MTRDEFEKEVKECNFVDEKFKNIYLKFKYYQDLAIQTLSELHSICEKNEIQYQLAFGSLLGAVRDNGQIPWDYDIDVFIPYSQKDKLINILKSELSEKYYFYCPEVSKNCRHYFMRIAPKGYDSSKLHVDVFYLIGAPTNDEENLRFDNQMRYLFNVRYVKKVKLSEIPKKKILKMIFNKLRYIFVNISKIDKKMEILCTKYDFDSSEKCIPVFDVYKHISFETKILKQTINKDTIFGTFRISSEYEKILHQIYGDYKRIFPLENRINEIITSYSKISGEKIGGIIHDKNIINGRYYID